MLTGHHSTTHDDYQLNVTSLLRQAAVTFGDTEVVYRNAEGGWSRSDYATEWKRAAQMAHALSTLGIGAGDVVGVLDWNSRHHMELYFTLPGLAATHLQLNIRLSREDLDYVVRHSGATWVVVDETLVPVAESLAENEAIQGWIILTSEPGKRVQTTLPNPVYLEDLMAEAPETYPWEEVDERTAAYAGYTTGTTGRPKGIFYSNRAVYLHAASLHTTLGVDHTDCVMPVTPMFHVMTWGFLHGSVMAGAKVVLPGEYSAADVAHLAEALVAEGVTLSNGAPAIWGPILDYYRHREEPVRLEGLRSVVAGSAPAPSLMKGFKDLTGADIIQGYGASETSPIVAVNWKPKRGLDLSEEELWELRTAQGLAAPTVDVKLMSLDGTELPHDGVSAGEVWYKGPYITREYFDRPESADAFEDGWWRSGDVGVIDEHGYLKLTDRLKDVIKSGGEWISSIDMENAILDNPRVAEAAVIGVPDEKWDERPVAYVVARPGEEVTDEDVRRLLSQRFAKWQIPERILIVDELPRTSVGKLNKKKLRADWAG